MAAARARGAGCGVLVRHGLYRTQATITLKDGVSVYGGCLFDDETDHRYRTMIDASPTAGAPAISGHAIGSSTTVHGLVVIREDAVAGGGRRREHRDGSHFEPRAHPEPFRGYTPICFVTCYCKYSRPDQSLGRAGQSSGSVPLGAGGSHHSWGGDWCTDLACAGQFAGPLGSRGNAGACSSNGGVASDSLWGWLTAAGWVAGTGGPGGEGGTGAAVRAAAAGLRSTSRWPATRRCGECQFLECGAGGPGGGTGKGGRSGLHGRVGRRRRRQRLGEDH